MLQGALWKCCCDWLAGGGWEGAGGEWRGRLRQREGGASAGRGEGGRLLAVQFCLHCHALHLSFSPFSFPSQSPNNARRAAPPRNELHRAHYEAKVGMFRRFLLLPLSFLKVNNEGKRVLMNVSSPHCFRHFIILPPGPQKYPWKCSEFLQKIVLNMCFRDEELKNM